MIKMSIKLVLSLLFIILLTGCSEEYITCKIELNNNKENYTLNSIYKIYYKDNYVTNITKEDKYSSTDKQILDYYYEYKNLEYQHFKDIYGGYEYNIDYKNNVLKIDANINMEEVNIKKMSLVILFYCTNYGILFMIDKWTVVLCQNLEIFTI